MKERLLSQKKNIFWHFQCIDHVIILGVSYIFINSIVIGKFIVYIFVGDFLSIFGNSIAITSRLQNLLSFQIPTLKEYLLILLIIHSFKNKVLTQL